MFIKVILVLGLLSVFTERTTQMATVIPICFDGDCYIKPENIGKPWTDAQQMCKKYDATLPVVDYPDRQRSLVAALYYFNLNGTADVWLGANASDYGAEKWRWLDGSQYSGTSIQGAGTYDRSYAFLSKNATGVLAFASAPYNNYSYICQYDTINTAVCTNVTGRLAFVKESQCYVKYNDVKLSWFNARYNCLENGGDLGSFGNKFPRDGIVDTNESWVGLRHSQWNWQNAVTGGSSDVKYTSWRSNQPNDEMPSCICIDIGDFPNWKDCTCSQLSQYLCQVVNTTSTDWTQVTHSSEPTTPFSTTGNVSIGKPGSAASQSEVNVPLAIGLGVGLGATLITVILIIITVIVVRRKHRNRESSEDSKTRGKFENENGRISPEEEATEMSEISHDRKSPLDDNASPNYATVMETRDLEPNSHHIASSNSQSQLDDSSPSYATVLETSHLEPNTQHATNTSQSQLDDTLPKYSIVQRARDFEPNPNHTPSQSQLNDASPESYYATVQEANDLEPNSQRATTTSQSPNYAKVQRARDLEPNSQQTATNTSQSHLDDALPVYGIVQKARDIEPISQETRSSNSQSHLDDASSNYGVVRKARDLEPNSQHSATTSESQLDDKLPNNATTVQETKDLEPISQDTIKSNYSQSQLDDLSPNYATIKDNNDLEPIAEDTTSQSQLDDASLNYAAIQEVSDLVPSSQQTATNTNESQLDDISPVYAMVQVAESLTQDSESTVNQSPVYADLDFCQGVS